MTCECSSECWFKSKTLDETFGRLLTHSHWKVKLLFALTVFSSPPLLWKHLPQKAGRKRMWMGTKSQMELQSDAARQTLSNIVTAMPNGRRENPLEKPSFEHELDRIPGIVF